MQSAIILVSVYALTSIRITKSQYTSGQAPNGETYICYPNGVACPTGNNIDGGVIDPRIVTPGDLCPSGFYPCYGQTLPCGATYTAEPGGQDGLSAWGSYPWQAYLRNDTHVFAGSGALLDPWHVLTAAHKVASNVNSPTRITVYMGMWDPANLTSVQASDVAKIFVHELYDPVTLKNDVALLRLAQPIVTGITPNINTACLPSTGSNFVGQTCYVAGWGQTSFSTDDAPTQPQKQVTVTVVSYQTCRSSYAQPSLLGMKVDNFLDAEGELCAGGQAMRDACTQDGGSPLICVDSTGKYNVAGLVIWGKNCGQPGVYGVYVNVEFYSAWIQDKITQSYAEIGLPEP